jgi:hypothetical protein
VEAAPIEGSYWVAPGSLLAGPYPGDADDRVARHTIARFEAVEIGLYLDLTEEDELPPYAHLLAGARHARMPIRDMGTTTTARYRATLNLVDDALSADERVYVHCYGGVGRTGTVVGCWLVRHALDGGDPLGRLAELRRGTAGAWMPSPQTAAQCRVVLDWDRGG